MQFVAGVGILRAHLDCGLRTGEQRFCFSFTKAIDPFADNPFRIAVLNREPRDRFGGKRRERVAAAVDVAQDRVDKAAQSRFSDFFGECDAFVQRRVRGRREKQQLTHAKPQDAADNRLLRTLDEVREVIVDREQMVERMVNKRGGQFGLALRQGRRQLFDAEVCIRPAIRDVAERIQRLSACVQMSTFPSSVFPAR